MIYGHLTPPPQRRPEVEPALPLVNVVFLLLIFFLVAGQLAPSAPVEPPASEQAREDEDPELVVLVLDHQGNLSVDGKILSIASIATGQDLLDPEQPVRLLTDKATPLEKIRPVLSALQKTGITEVRLVTRGSSP